MFDPVNLLNSAAFPHPVAHPKLLETHISWVVLTGSFAYKIKKPCRFDFVDYSQLSLRHHFCQLELQLNRRLAAELYLGVVPIIALPNGQLQFGDIDQTTTELGSIVEYAVKMIEFPQDAILAQRLNQTELPSAAIDRLATGIARFHDSIEVVDPQLECVQLPHIRQDALDNFELLQRELPVDHECQTLLKKLKEWTEQEFARCHSVFADRLNRGFVRRCHGDMHLNNLVMVDGKLFAFDCIEFNEEFQWIDVISDLAFPLMDFIAAGRSDLGWRLLNVYLETREDWFGIELLRFYSVYRAMVRAKVQWLNSCSSLALLASNQEAPDSNESNVTKPHLPTWQVYLSTAKRIAFNHYYRESHKPEDFQSLHGSRDEGREVDEDFGKSDHGDRGGRGGRLAITFGVAGSGKSTRAMEYIQQYGGIRLRSDIERTRIEIGDHSFASSPGTEDVKGTDRQTTGHDGPVGNERYSAISRAAVYQRLYELADWLLKQDYTVVVDATFLLRHDRQRFQQLAEKHQVSFRILSCQAPQDELVRRIESRTNDPSEATRDVLFQQLTIQEPLTNEEQRFCQTDLGQIK